MQSGTILNVRWDYINGTLTFSPLILTDGKFYLTRSFWQGLDFKPKVVKFNNGVYLYDCISAFSGLECDVLDLTNLKIPKNSNVTDMFRGTYGEIIGLDTLDFQHFTELNSMFFKCTVNILDLSKIKFTDTEQAHYMFKQAKIGELYLPEMENLQYSNNIFMQADIGIITGLGTYKTLKTTQDTFLQSHIDELNLPNLTLQSYTNLQGTFVGARINKLDISSFDTEVNCWGQIFHKTQIQELHIKNKDVLERLIYNGLEVDD